MLLNQINGQLFPAIAAPFNPTLKADHPTASSFSFIDFITLSPRSVVGGGLVLRWGSHVT